MENKKDFEKEFPGLKGKGSQFEEFIDKKLGIDERNIKVYLVKDIQENCKDNQVILDAIDQNTNEEINYPRHSDEGSIEYCHRIKLMERARIKEELRINEKETKQTGNC